VGRLVIDDTSAAARWPAWFAPAGFLIAVGGTLVLASLITGIGIAAGVDERGDSPTIALVSTLVQDVVLVGTALALAARIAPPQPGDFGLRPAPAGRAVVLTLAGLASFYALSAAYAALVRPDGEQETLEQLGADRGAGYLVASAVLVIALAPVVEEVFFRGFMYRALRNRWSPLLSATAIGVIFGSIHYSGPETLELLPVLAFLGATFCWLYEATGSLYPAIAVHAVNNTLAFTTTAEPSLAGPLGVGLGAAMLTACFVVPARQARRGA
jgi:membrane protease YdiL (CAAX protease family)